MTIIALCGNQFIADSASTCTCGKCEQVISDKIIIPQVPWLIESEPVLALAFSGISTFRQNFRYNELSYRESDDHLCIGKYLDFLTSCVMNDITNSSASVCIVTKGNRGYRAWVGRLKTQHTVRKGCKVSWQAFDIFAAKLNKPMVIGSGADTHKVYFKDDIQTLDSIWMAASRTDGCNTRLDVLDLPTMERSVVRAIPKSRQNTMLRRIKHHLLGEPNGK